MLVRKERVIWTSEEIGKVAAIVARLRISDPTAQLHTLITKAVEQLPAHRRRVVNTSKSVPKVVREISRHLQIIWANAEKGSLPPLPPPSPPPPPPTTEQVLESVPTEKLFSVVLGRVFGVLNVMQKQQTSVEEYVKRLVLQITTPAEKNGAVLTVKTIKPRIAVVGLLGEQQQKVGAAVGHKVDLRFMTSDQRPAFPDVDHIILMCKFIPHAWDIVAVSTRVRVHRHRGGISELINLLHEICR